MTYKGKTLNLKVKDSELTDDLLAKDNDKELGYLNVMFGASDGIKIKQMQEIAEEANQFMKQEEKKNASKNKLLRKKSTLTIESFEQIS